MSTAKSTPSGEKRSVGFRAAPARKLETTPTQRPSVAPTGMSPRSAPPLPKRAKGRFFVGVIFLTVIATVGYSVYAAFLQFRAFGVIHGRVITVSAPWDGVVESWRFRDGDTVDQGDLVTEISNLEMKHAAENFEDELKLVQAEIQAELSKIQIEQRENELLLQKAKSEFLVAEGELAQQKSKFEELTSRVKRASRLVKSKNLSIQKYEDIYYEYIGQKNKLETLNRSVEVLKERVTVTEQSLQRSTQKRTGPLLVKVERIQSQMRRLQESLKSGKMCVPVNGRITKRHMLTGESVKKNEPVVEILEDGSIEAILYLPQKMVDEISIGQTIQISLEPYDQLLKCEVVRFGEQFEPAPENISRFYRLNQYLLPVYLRPLPEYRQFMALRINGTVRLPFDWQKRTVDWWQETFDNVCQWWLETSGTPEAEARLNTNSEKRLTDKAMPDQQPPLAPKEVADE